MINVVTNQESDRTAYSPENYLAMNYNTHIAIIYEIKIFGWVFS